MGCRVVEARGGEECVIQGSGRVKSAGLQACDGVPRVPVTKSVPSTRGDNACALLRRGV